MADPFASSSKGLSSPADKWVAITPNDGADLTDTPRAIFVGVGGSIALKDAAGTTFTFKNVPSGSIISLRPVRVMATNTTATDMAALY